MNETALVSHRGAKGMVTSSGGLVHAKEVGVRLIPLATGTTDGREEASCMAAATSDLKLGMD